MPQELQKEIDRLVGSESVEIFELPTQEEANHRVQLQTANAVYKLPANRLLALLRKLPDRIGVEGLREAIERELEFE